MLVALFLVAAIAAFLFLPNIQDALVRPQGPVLVYEIDPDSMPAGATIDINIVVRAIERRFGVGGNRLAFARAMDDHRIEVAVVGNSEADKRRVESLLGCVGTLEFRILADRRDDRSLIERALADPSKSKLRDAAGNIEAWWVPIETGQEKTFSAYRDIALRQRTTGGRQISEVLVLNDDYNVTGAYLTRASGGVDQQGRPCINFTLNRHGGEQFGELTSNHLPDKLSGCCYSLAIILDNVVYSAPSIRGTIYDRGEITGRFTMQEVHDIVNILNAGSLPARIRPVKR